MNPGEGRSSGRARPARRRVVCVAGLFALLLGGCAADRASVEKGLLADGNAARRSAGVTEHYLIGCPDAIELRVRGRPELAGPYTVEPTGRIALGEHGPLHIEGRTPAEAARLIAAAAGVAPGDVEVRVTAFRSQYLFLSGQIIGWQRTVPYQGQETVLDLLQRIGGITTGAELKDVYVTRPRLEQNQRPEVFHVNLQAIVLKKNDETNIRLMPFDQVYVGESQQAQLEKAFPPWLRPVYQTFWNMRSGPERPPVATAAASRWIAGE